MGNDMTKLKNEVKTDAPAAATGPKAGTAKKDVGMYSVKVIRELLKTCIDQAVSEFFYLLFRERPKS